MKYKPYTYSNMIGPKDGTRYREVYLTTGMVYIGTVQMVGARWFAREPYGEKSHRFRNRELAADWLKFRYQVLDESEEID